MGDGKWMMGRLKMWSDEWKMIRKMSIRLKFIFLLTILNLSVGCAQERTDKNVKPQLSSTKEDGIPASIGKVSDFEKIFAKAQIDTLNKLLNDFELESGIQMVVVSIDTSLVSKAQFENFVLDLANKWGVGEKNKNNGVVIGFSTGHRKIRIANGYGVEKLISDRETNLVMERNFLVHFKKNEYYEGTIEGVKALIDLLKTKIKK